MKNICIILLAIVVSTVSCESENDRCEDAELQVLKLDVIDAEIRLPSYRIVDSTIYGPGRTMLNYEIMSIDSLVHAFIMVDDYHDYSDGQLDLNRIQSVQKKEVESGKNLVQFLTDEIRNIDGRRIGYFKYLVKQSTSDLLASRIFFYKDRKLVVIWIQDKSTTLTDKAPSLSDCILNSLTLKN